MVDMNNFWGEMKDNHRVFLESAAPENLCYHLNASAVRQLPADSLSAMKFHASACMPSLMKQLIECQCIQVVTKIRRAEKNERTLYKTL